MSSIRPFTGSKRKARARARHDRQAKALQQRLDAIADLARRIRDESHLRQILADCPDDAARAEVRKFLEPLLPFPIGRVQLAEVPVPATVSAVVLPEF